MRLNKLYLLLPCIILGCSFFNRNVENLVEYDKKKHQLTSSEVQVKKDNYCFDKSRFQLIVEDESANKFYTPLIPRIFKNKKFSFYQKIAALSILEMFRRPDKASPTSRVQFFIHTNKKDIYYDFRPRDLNVKKSLPFLKAVEFILKIENTNQKLSTFTQLLDLSSTHSFPVSLDFEQFLNKNKKEISKDPALTSYYFKGDDVLTRHENFNIENFSNLIKKITLENKFNDDVYDYDKIPLNLNNFPGSNSDISCNMNISNDKEMPEPFSSEFSGTHYFGLKEEDSYFIAVNTSYFPRPIKSISSSLFFESLPTPTPIPICNIKNKNLNLILFSISGRSPSQHLRHLINYNIQSSNSFLELFEILNFPRHLFLTNPDRILYESLRGRKSQLDYFLAMNFPIYHVETLGNIIGHVNFIESKNENSSLIVDTRSFQLLKCE